VSFQPLIKSTSLLLHLNSCSVKQKRAILLHESINFVPTLVIYCTLFIINIYVSQWGERHAIFLCVYRAALKRDLMRAHAEIYANGKQPAHYRVHAQMAKKDAERLQNASARS